MAAVSMLLAANVSQALPVGSFNVDSVSNGVDPSLCGVTCEPLNTGIAVNIGDTVVISTDYLDSWNINGQAVNAVGFSSGSPIFGSGYGPNPNYWNGPSFSTTPNFTLQYGALAYSLDGLLWGAVGNNADPTDTNVSFIAGMSGTLLLAMWDSTTSDNASGSVDTTLTAHVDLTPASGSASVPEPGILALLGLGLAGISVSRRARKR